MPIDASIIGGLKSLQIDSPVDNYGKMMTLQNLMQTNQIGQIGLQNSQRDQADDARQRDYSMQAGGDMGKLRDLMYSGGLLKQGQALDKAMSDQAKAKADIAHLGAQSGKLQGETLGIAIGQHRDELNNVNSYDDAVNWVKSGYANPALAQVTKNGNLQQSLAGIPQDPQAFQQWKMQGSLSAEKLIQMTTPSADAVLGAKTSTANNSTTVGATVSGQDKTAATAAAALDQKAAQFDQTMEAGKNPAGYRKLPNGDLQAIPGGPADLKINAAGVAKVGDAKEVLSLLDEVDKLLPKATGSYLGSAYDKVAGGLGMGTQGAASGAQLKALEGALIAKMPKMSGPQSDKDVLLYRQMAGQVGDETIPVSQRQAAAAMLRKLNERYEGVPEGSSKQTPAAQPDGAVSKSKSGKDIVMRGGKWEYQ